MESTYKRVTASPEALFSHKNRVRVRLQEMEDKNAKMRKYLWKLQKEIEALNSHLGGVFEL